MRFGATISFAVAFPAYCDTPGGAGNRMSCAYEAGVTAVCSSSASVSASAAL